MSATKLAARKSRKPAASIALAAEVEASLPTYDHDADYADFIAAVRATFDEATADKKTPLFQTAADTDGLWKTYLDHLPGERQVHDCRCCRRFIHNFGGLVFVADNGQTVSALWNPDTVPRFYCAPVSAMQRVVTGARIVAPHLSDKRVWGEPMTGAWTHLSVAAPSVFSHALLTPGQAAAAKREDFNTVARALADFKPPVLTEALVLLEAAALARSEKFIGPVRWLQGLHAQRRLAPSDWHRHNLLWEAIATAPDGYCHPRSSVIGPLLEDIAAGLPFEDVKAKFDAKLHPLRYQRPQAAPAAGNVVQAERTIKQMGLEPSLERRFARLEEVECFWKPPAAAPARAPGAGVFDHLVPKNADRDVIRQRLPRTTMTWDKFRRMVLVPKVAAQPDAIEVLLPGHGDFTALVTAANADAPPIMKWDRGEARNPVSSYVYHGGSPAARWGLREGEWRKVTGISARPNEWGNYPMPHLGQGAILILDGAADQNEMQGSALFPESLRSELLPIRATIEAYSKTAKLGGRDRVSACGLAFNMSPGPIGQVLRVTTATHIADYLIDRWD